MPPVSGIIAPSSAYTNAPKSENNPAITHTTVSHTGEPNCSAILAGFIKTPDPMILPTIIEVADQKPIFLARDELVDILKRKITKKPCRKTRLLIHFTLASTRISCIWQNILSGRIQIFPGKINRYGRNWILPILLKQLVIKAKIKRTFFLVKYPGKYS